jgi:hypothetical protein
LPVWIISRTPVAGRAFHTALLTILAFCQSIAALQLRKNM